MREVLLERGAVEAMATRPDAAKLAAWWKQVNEWRKKDCLRYEKNGGAIKPQYVLEKLWEITGGDAFVTSDVGQHQMWAAQYYRFDKPRRWINSGGLGTMGVGLPYAMGVQMANPGADVAVITAKARSSCASRSCRSAEISTGPKRSSEQSLPRDGAEWQQLGLRWR